MTERVLRCVGWIFVAFATVLLADVCKAQPGKIIGYREKKFPVTLEEISSVDV